MSICFVVTTDRGQQFELALFASLVQLLGTRHIHITAYHPSTNGTVEHLHQQLKSAVTAREERTHWVDRPAMVLLGLCSTFKADLNCTSARLVYGTSSFLPGEILNYTSGSSNIRPLTTVSMNY